MRFGAYLYLLKKTISKHLSKSRNDSRFCIRAREATMIRLHEVSTLAVVVFDMADSSGVHALRFRCEANL